ncbi:hypothetical protein GGR50DRAFT_116903 [Xylaria sp. CBS 124048]|nr:hypothetical protein GGR50DRAFT_116903 [Xylaria sp. CBS 124048]
MASLTPPSSSDSNRLAAFTRLFTGKGMRSSPPSPCSEPGLSRSSSTSLGVFRRVSRKVVPGLPRVKTFKRQQSEDRDRLEAFLPTPAERRAVSIDRRMHLQRGASYSSQTLPGATGSEFFGAEPPVGKLAALSRSASSLQNPDGEIHVIGPNDIDSTAIVGGEVHGEVPYPDDTRSIDTSQYDDMIRDELERKWILNISMYFRDKSMREKFFVTYRQRESVWRRVTLSLDYRDAPTGSLELELRGIKSQRLKSSKIYEAIRESLQDILFFPTVTNLKLETIDKRLHVHVVEDVNEIIPFPTISMVEHMNCRRIRESQIKFDCHMSGFVYKVHVGGKTLIKKEIPGPDTIEEFLYEINALNSLRFSRSIIDFYGLVVDDDDEIVKGLLISYAEQGALIDVIDSYRGQGLPWGTRARWARQIVQGLADIHETGFVQGDFTLSNIVIDNHENAKIIDINRRGCPVGWEPPEAIALINSNQRISMYIGVKSDLYQLGMVLWALATLNDDPESHRPLSLKAELNIPSWYRDVVETCLQEDPRLRSQAIALLSKFPEDPYDGVYEDEWGAAKISANECALLGTCAEDESYVPREIRNRWLSSPVSNTQGTLPMSDELYCPPRGRSPPSPSPNRLDLYNSRHIYGNGMWAKGDGIAAMEGSLAPEEMADELEQMAANLCHEAVPEYEQTQAPGGNSLAQDAPLEADSVEPIAVAGGHNDNASLSDEEEVKDSTSTYDPTPSERSLEGTTPAE